jgi:hypothetical protein
MQDNRIKVYMAPGEADREQCMRSVLSHDTRFESLQIDSSIPVDLQFKVVEHIGHDLLGEEYCEKILDIELKRSDDFVSSVLSGHLYDQILSIRESRQDGCVVILGDLGDISGAIRDASELRAGKHLRGDEFSQAIATNHNRCKSFRKRSFLNGIPIFYVGDDSGFFDNLEEDEKKNKTGVWKDILELAHDYLLDGDMLGFRMRPAENEREIAAASMLYKGIGDSSMSLLLKEYELRFFPKPGARPIEEIPGFGKKRCDQIRARVNYT